MAVVPAPRARVLVVDDDDDVLKVHARALARHGCAVESAGSGASALELIGRERFDVILSDIDMPGMNGIELLERIRGHDLDVPIVFVTGTPSIDTAAQAVEYGALRYLTKPVPIDTLIKVVDDATRLHHIARAKRKALDLAGGVEHLVGDHAGLVTSFERALDGLHLAYQPIVRWSTQTVFAYEALVRSREPSLPHPAALFDAAERLGKVRELGRHIRRKAPEPSARLDGALLFVNIDPSDLLDDDLFAPGAPLTEIADRTVLEITERASLHAVHDIGSRIAALRTHGFRIAIDDLGAGYAGLSSFALLEPDVVKLDMGLVRNLHREPTKQTLVRTIVAMCDELGILVTAEGIESADERDEVVRLGCDLLQGYLFARPGEAFPVPRF